LVSAATTEISGVFNVAGPQIAFADFLEACRRPDVPAELVWISSEHLLEANVDPWMGVALWIGGSGWEAANAVDISRAIASGLSFRPLAETIEGAVAWHCEDISMPIALSTEKELIRRFAREQ
jgi:2'-hydroxyisoflavone reductase